MQLYEDKFNVAGFYRALVVDNDDPDQLGRVKIRIPGVLGTGDQIPVNYLPWAVPATSIFTGSGSDYGNFAVPEVGSYVFVFFEAEDIYQPVYFAEAPTKLHGLPSERTTNYPYRKVLKTKNGLIILVDDFSKEIQINHPTGASLKIDSSGNVTIIGGAIIIQGTTIDINP